MDDIFWDVDNFYIAFLDDVDDEGELRFLFLGVLGIIGEFKGYIFLVMIQLLNKDCNPLINYLFLRS
jgi:hypothetical protein